MLKIGPLSEALAREAAEAALKAATSLRDNAYKVELAKGLIKQAIRSLPSRKC